MIRRILALCIVLAAMSPVAANAQTAAQTDRAEQLFTEASALAAAGRYAEACPKFEESQRLDAALGTQFNLALCFEKIGRLGSAWRNLRSSARLAHQTMKTGREAAARQKMDQIQARVPHLVISGADADVTVKVDGEVVDREGLGFWGVDSGDHDIEASGPAKTSWRSRVTIAASGPTEHLVQVPPLAAAKGETKVVSVSNPKRTLGFVIGAVGLAGIGAAVVTGVAILNDKSIADERCAPPGACTDESARDAVATGKALVPINAIAWGVGIVGLGVGSFLVLTSRPEAKTAAGQVSVSVGLGGGSASVRF